MVHDSMREARMLENLREYSNDLKQLPAASLPDCKKTRPVKYAPERIIFLIIQNILNILEHYLSTQFKIVNDTNEDIIDVTFHLFSFFLLVNLIY